MRIDNELDILHNTNDIIKQDKYIEILMTDIKRKHCER